MMFFLLCNNPLGQSSWDRDAQTVERFSLTLRDCGTVPPCSPGDTWTETLAYVLFWGSASAGTAAVILFNGLDFVDAPKLVQKEKMD